MIKRHLNGADYLVAFEYHDDVVFMEPNEEPENVDFCQVKTKKSIFKRCVGVLFGATSGEGRKETFNSRQDV